MASSITANVINGSSVSANVVSGNAITASVVANTFNYSVNLTNGVPGAQGVPGESYALALTGNTAGTMATVSTGTLYLAGGSNITLSQNGQSISINGGAGATGVTPGISGSNGSFSFSTVTFGNLNGLSFYTTNGSMAGSYTVPTVPAQTEYVFSNSNGVSFGTNGSTITATVATNYQSQGAYLTTARASNDAVGLNTAQTNVTWTVNSAGISFNAGAYLTTAQPVGAYLTTAAQSNHSHGNPTLNLTNLTGTTASASNGLTLSLSGNAAQTVQTQNLMTVNGTQGNVSISGGNGVTVGNNLSTVTISVATNYQSQGAYLTTAAQSNQVVNSINGSTGVFTFNTGSSLSSSRNANSITWGLASNITTALQSAGAYLTTAMASNRGSDFVQANAVFNGTNASGTIASNGISVSVAAPGGGGGAALKGSGTYTQNTGTVEFANSNGITFGLSNNGTMTASHNGLTTAMASNRGTDFVQANAVFNGTNASGTIASNGISVSVAAPGAAAENNWVHALGANTAGNTTASGSTLGFSGINLTLSGTNGSVLNFSAPATSSLSATGRVSLSTNGSTISIGVPNALTVSRYNEFKEGPLVAGDIGNGTLHVQPWLIPNLHMDRVILHKAFSNASNSSNSFTVSNLVGIYTNNASTLSLLHSVSGSTNFSGSGTVGSYLSYGGGIKALTLGLTQTLTEGMYWVGVIQRSTTGGGAGHTLNQALKSNLNSSYRGIMGEATNISNQMSLGLGGYSATTSAMPSSILFGELRGNSSAYIRPPSVIFQSGTI